MKQMSNCRIIFIEVQAGIHTSFVSARYERTMSGIECFFLWIYYWHLNVIRNGKCWRISNVLYDIWCSHLLFTINILSSYFKFSNWAIDFNLPGRFISDAHNLPAHSFYSVERNPIFNLPKPLSRSRLWWINSLKLKGKTSPAPLNCRPEFEFFVPKRRERHSNSQKISLSNIYFQFFPLSFRFSCLLLHLVAASSWIAWRFWNEKKRRRGRLKTREKASRRLSEHEICVL